MSEDKVGRIEIDGVPCDCKERGAKAERARICAEIERTLRDVTDPGGPFAGRSGLEREGARVALRSLLDWLKDE